MLGALGQGVAHEGQRGGVPQPGLAAHLGPDQPGGAGERGSGVGLFLRRPVDGVVDRRLPQVAGEPRLGDRHETEPGVLDPPLQHLGHDLDDPVGELARSRRVHGHLIPPR